MHERIVIPMEEICTVDGREIYLLDEREKALLLHTWNRKYRGLKERRKGKELSFFPW